MRSVEACLIGVLANGSSLKRWRLEPLAAGLLSAVVAISALALFLLPCVALADEGGSSCSGVFSCECSSSHSDSAAYLKEDFTPDLEIIPSLEESFSPDLEIVEDPEGDTAFYRKEDLGFGGTRLVDYVGISIVVSPAGLFAMIVDAIKCLLQLFL